MTRIAPLPSIPRNQNPLDIPSGFFLCQKGVIALAIPLEIFRNPYLLEQRIESYFQECEASREVRNLKSGDIRVRQKMPTMVGLAVHLGIDKSTLYAYLNNERADTGCLGEKEHKAIQDTLARARTRIELALLERAADGDCDSRTAAILLGSYGYAAKVEQTTKATVVVEGATSKDVEDWSV